MKFFSLMLAFLSTSVIFSQGAWTKSKNEGYVQLSYYSIAGYSGLYGDPDYRTERKISDNTLQLYSEYGVTDKTTFIFSLPIKMIDAKGLVDATSVPVTLEGSETALGNLTIGIKHLLHHDKWVVSGQLNIEPKTGKFFSDQGIRSGYDTWTLAPKLNIGRSFNRLFVQGSTGIDVRFNGYSSNFRFDAEIGAKPFKGLWAIGFLNLSSSFKNGGVVLPASNLLTGLYVNDQEYAAYGLKFIFEITQKIGVLANYTTAISGNNVPKRAVLGGGLYHKF